MTNDRINGSTNGLNENEKFMPKRCSYRKFLEISDKSNERYEYIDGQVYLMDVADTVHQYVLGKIYFTFLFQLKGNDCNIMVMPTNFILKRSVTNINFVQPDLLIFCDQIGSNNENIPILILEVLSENTREKDSVEKKNLYMSSGIKEYWVIDPIQKEITIHVSVKNGIESRIYTISDDAISRAFDGLIVRVNNVFD